PLNSLWFINQTKLEAIKADQPKDTADFKRLLTEWTRPKDGVYGIAGINPTFGLITAGGAGDSPMSSLFGAPNNWSVDANGKFVKDFETPEFQASVDYVRDLYASGVYWPEPINIDGQVRSLFVSGKILAGITGWAGYKPF